MKRFLFAAAVLAMAAAAVPAFAADVGVSINVGQPGFYGQINIGDAPPPRLIYQQPMMIQRTRVVGQPIYLHVPPGHAKHWSKHCGRYNACGRQVYFVQDNWYNDVYVPRYREHQGGWGEGHGRGNQRGGHNEDRGQRHGDQERGHGNGHDKGNDKGHDNGHGKHRNDN